MNWGMPSFRQSVRVFASGTRLRVRKWDWAGVKFTYLSVLVSRESRIHPNLEIQDRLYS